jgi:hypothetical protein
MSWTGKLKYFELNITIFGFKMIYNVQFSCSVPVSGSSVSLSNACVKNDITKEIRVSSICGE